jgi:hypothetical protein
MEEGSNELMDPSHRRRDAYRTFNEPHLNRLMYFSRESITNIPFELLVDFMDPITPSAQPNGNCNYQQNSSPPLHMSPACIKSYPRELAMLPPEASYYMARNVINVTSGGQLNRTGGLMTPTPRLV